MKKIIVITLISLFTSYTLEAQKKKLFQNFGIGLISTAGGATDHESEKSVVFEKSLMPSIELGTKRTSHNVMYNLFDHSFATLHAVLFPHGLDAYFVYSRNFKTDEHYSGVGIEKTLFKREAGNNGLDLLVYLELGTNKDNAKCSFGLLLNLKRFLWKRE